MSDLFQRFGNALQYFAIAMMTAAILFIGLVLWDLEKRVPAEIPPKWFEDQVRDIRSDVRDNEATLKAIQAIELSELRAKVLLLDKDLRELRERQ